MVSTYSTDPLIFWMSVVKNVIIYIDEGIFVAMGENKLINVIVSFSYTLFIQLCAVKWCLGVGMFK